ncbi:MAG: adenylyltransferase/cytidyltransferase family protein [Dehalococcoidales bacterium]|nr:adenylyltransferase/cytidyltransferase family protein [Dehalococcoidales bacterium]
MTRKLVTVAISGAFDPIHVGHLRYIQESAKLGDILIVILNSDEFLLRKKGFVFRPFEDRKELLENIRGVDKVIASIDEDQTVSKTLKMLKPDIFAKGGIRTGPENIPEAATCEIIGCKLVTHVGGDQIRANGDMTRIVKGHEMEGETRMRVTCPYCDDHPILREKCTYCKGTGKIVVEK